MSEAPQVLYDQTAPIVHQEQKQALGREEAYNYWNDPHRSAIPPTAQSESQYGTILGLRRRNFWIVLIMVLLLVGATIGGSVGGALAVRNSGSTSNSSSEPTQSVAVSSSASISSPVSLQSSPTISPSSATPSTPIVPNPADVQKIDVACPQVLQDYNRKAYDCDNNRTIPMQPGATGDLTGMVAYTLQQCVDACSTYNQVAGNTTCRAVVLISFLRSSYFGNKGANCWLKKTGDGATESAGYTLARVKI